MGANTDRLMRPLRIYKSPSELPSLEFSRPAEAAVERQSRSHRYGLIAHSRALAIREEADNVSEVHVDRASRDLRGSDRQPKKHVATIGGVLSGASLSTLMNIFGDLSSPDNLFGLGLLVFFILGIFLIAEGHKRRT